MKTIRSMARLSAVLFLFTLGFTACQKEASEAQDVSIDEQEATVQSTEAEAEADVVFDDVSNNVLGVNEDVGMGGTGVFMRTDGNAGWRNNPCFTVSVTQLQPPQLFPLKVVTDFGDGCTIRGHTRKGKIITIYTGRLTVPGKSAITTFDGYMIDSVKVEGTHVIANTSSGGTPQFTAEVVGKLTKPNGNYIDWKARRVMTQAAGADTPRNPTDDVLKVEGSATGFVHRGDRIINWQSTITEPLYKRFTCRWFSKGVIVVQRENTTNGNKREAKLDYGNGDCDNKAVLTINGREFQIYLR